ncbi:hypothetical protein [Lentibacillus saliphilus]|uniref:hypothetical protein n=1 Tax=Lentibacillus saliphilus TaxID=2737028 RepID=UPI001C30BCF4|nr:hypothetical protein [Lentibacillus saliphilus]
MYMSGAIVVVLFGFSIWLNIFVPAYLLWGKLRNRILLLKADAPFFIFYSNVVVKGGDIYGNRR